MRLIASLVAMLAVGASPVESINPVTVELFTSQGCSSCPPADAFAEQLAKRSDVVIMTRPVTYWDRLGWKDTLAREANTDLQRAYAARGGEGEGVYTPQMMVQGRFGAVGSERATVLRQIDRARRDIKAAIAFRPGVIAVAGEGSGAEIKLIGLRAERVVRIGSGENGGRVVRYSNVVESERSLGRWTGGTQKITLPTLPESEGLRWAIIVQQGRAGAILAARYI